MTTIIDHPTRKADKCFSEAKNQDIDTVLRLKNYFDGLKVSIKNSLSIKDATETWELLDNDLSQENQKEEDLDQTFKYLSFLLYECDFVGSDYELGVDDLGESISSLSNEHLETEEDDSKSGIVTVEQLRSDTERIHALQATRHEWIPRLKYHGFLAADGFQVLLENSFPDSDPAEYIANFIQSFYQPKKNDQYRPRLRLDQNSIICGEQWHPLLLNIAEWCCLKSGSDKLSYEAIKYIISGWNEDEKSYSYLSFCLSISACGNQLVYKSAINRLADTGLPDLSLACESEPQNDTEDSYFLLALLFLPLFKNTGMYDKIDGYFNISKNNDELIESFKTTTKNKEIDPKIIGNTASRMAWYTALEKVSDYKYNYKIMFDGDFVLSCTKYIYKIYEDTLYYEIHEDEEYLALYWECLNKGYNKFRHDCFGGNSDLSIIKAADIHNYHTKNNVALYDNPDLAIIVGVLSDIECRMSAISYHDEPYNYMSDLMHELFVDNPWQLYTSDKYAKSNPYTRWSNYKSIIVQLNVEGLHKVADAFLAFYIVTEGFVFSGTYPNWDDLLLIIKKQLKNKSDYTKQSIVWIRQYLLENNKKWEALRFDQFELDNQNYQIEISEVLNSLLDTIKLTAEEDIIKKIGMERLGSLNPEGKEMLLNCHRQYNQLKAFIDFGTMTDLGGLVFEFFRFMENQLNNKLLSTYMSDSYRNWKCSNKKHGSWGNKPTMRSFLFFLDDVAARRVPPDIVNIVDRQVSFHTNKKFLSKLHKLHKDYRNDPAHGVVLSQEQFLEFWGKLYTDKYMLDFIDCLQPKLES